MGYGRNLFVRRVQLEAERRLLEQASKVDLGHFDNSDWHDRLARAKRDVSWRPGDLTWSVLGLSGNIVTIVLMAGLLASLHWVLVFLALMAAILSLVLERRVTARLYEFFYKETPEEREREYLGDLLVQPRTTKEIRAYVLADYLLGRHRDRSEELYRQRELMYRSGTRVSMLTGLVTGTALALAYLFVAIEGVSGTIDPGGVVLVIGAFTSVSATLGNISSTFVAVDQHTTFLEDYFSFLAVGRLIPVPERPREVPKSFEAGIEFDEVTFTLSGRHRTRGRESQPAHSRRRADRAGRRERRGQEHADQAAAAFLRSLARRHSGWRRRSARARSGGVAQPHRRAVPGLCELRVFGSRERADGPSRARLPTIAKVLTRARGRAQRLAAEEDAQGPRREGRPAVRRRPRSVGRRVAAPRAGAHHVSRRRHLDSRRAHRRRSIPKRRRRSLPS